jgi:hypothetical protein
MIDDGILLAYSELCEGDPDRPAHSDLIRSVGSAFASAADCVACFIAERCGSLDR